jgi:3,4-dihydroxy 2-butanone 4-phosphate synthase/GTP cyclohydrolase II
MRELQLKRQAEARIPTNLGDFNMITYADTSEDRMPDIAMVADGFDAQQPVILRIHSECMTGDVFGSKRCDCGEQLQTALQLTAAQGGVVIYLRQEGRGIGLIHKLKAYNLQDAGLNTIDANTHLGFDADARQYDAAIFILRDLGIQSVRLLTNNPDKVLALQRAGIEVVERMPILIPPQAESRNYLKTKADLMGHLIGEVL